MSNGLDPLNEIAQAGFFATCASSVLIPAGWTTAGLMLPAIGDPGQLLEAGLEWLEVGKALWEASDQNIAVTNAVGAIWPVGEAREAFLTKAADLSQALMIASVHAYCVAAALLAASAAVALVCSVIGIMGVGFVIWAYSIVAAISAAAGTLGLGSPAVIATMASANIYAADCTSALTSMDAVLMKIYTGGAAALAAALGANVTMQATVANNDEALGDLVQGTVLGLPTMASGLVAALFTKGLGSSLGSGGPIVRGLGTLLGSLGLDPIGDATEHADPSRW